MADVQLTGQSPHYGYDYEQEYPSQAAEPQGLPADASRVGSLINWAGALVSMGLVIGMGVWAWQLLVRDVADVPVIRALEGPMRVAPEDPGGAVAENQGLAVNRLAEGEEAAPVPDQLVLAPPPVELEAADPEPEERAFENASTALPGIDDDLPAVAEDEALVAAETEDTSALIERLIAEAQPLDEVAEAEPQVARADTIPLSVPGVNRSPRPPSRPAGLQARAEAVEAASAAADAAVAAAETDPDAGPTVDETGGGFEIAASELEAGARLVQLGAFDTPDLAREEWQRLAQNYPDFFLGRARVIEEANSGGQTFYRLRAHGFGDLAASRRFCAALVAQGAACIPVTVR